MNPMDVRNTSNSRPKDAESRSSSPRGLLSEIADAIAEQKYQRGFLQAVTLKDCIRYYREEAGKPECAFAAGFVLSVRKNFDPRNENDNYIVVQGLVDHQSKPITANGETVSRVIHTRTIDDALIKALNGEESVILWD